MTKGIVFNIQKFSIHDGPGIRTTVFLKGCPLKCKWCANPESQSSDIQIMINHDKCIGCQKCVINCPKNAILFRNHKIHINFDLCVGCLTCVHNCTNHALEYEGEYKDLDEVVRICMQDEDFYIQSDGGVTLSGGEALIQEEFVQELVTKLHEKNIHVAVETTGYIEHESFKRLAKNFDLLLFDVKHYDTNQHQLGTGVNNEKIIQNLSWAIENHIEVLPRIPVIPGFNDTLEDALGLAHLLKQLHINKVQLLPFHQFGQNKYELLNRDYELKEVKALHPEDLKDYQHVFFDLNIDCYF